MKRDELDWLVTHRFREVIRHEFNWTFEFHDDVRVFVDCLWRLVKDGCVSVASEDDGQQFGLPTPVDGVARIHDALNGGVIRAVSLQAGTLDLELHFDSGHILQIIPTSSGYEAWNVLAKSRQFIAVGGGELTIFSEDN